MKIEKNYDVLEISGNPFSKGRQYGKEKKKEIDNLINYLYSTFENDKTSKTEILNHVKKHIPYIEAVSPIITEELKGIAQGSDKLYEEIAMIHLHEEKSGFSSHNCTAFAATGTATRDGETLIGQTWDISKNLCENCGAFILKEKNSNEPDILAYTYAGLLSGAGINSKGLSLVWNSVPRLKIKVGVPTYIIINQILRQNTIGEAIATVLKVERAGCFNFLIADESEIYNLEATPDDVHISYSCSYFGHANHYLSEKLDRQQNIARVASEYSASTIIRQNRINRKLEENRGKIDVSSCQDFMRDHVNFPESICRHPDPQKEKDKRLITCSSFIMVPAKRELIISNGPACENEFNSYTF